MEAPLHFENVRKNKVIVLSTYLPNLLLNTRNELYLEKCFMTSHETLDRST